MLGILPPAVQQAIGEHILCDTDTHRRASTVVPTSYERGGGLFPAEGRAVHGGFAVFFQASVQEGKCGQNALLFCAIEGGSWMKIEEGDVELDAALKFFSKRFAAFF